MPTAYRTASIVDPAGPALASDATLTDTGENLALVAGIAAFIWLLLSWSDIERRKPDGSDSTTR
ncbi:MAG: hypothetical protein WDN27_05105 [Candidatus Saccharibacteria bacterium]